MSQTSVSYLWREPNAARGFRAGVSLHSHTNQSKETLDFIADLSTDWKILQPVIVWCERRCMRWSGIRPDYAKSFWTPPLTPKLAFDVELRQIEEKLDMPGLVSLTDHDDIRAPVLLRTVAPAQNIPVSVEWTVPYGGSAFHLGIHNLPAATAAAWMRRFEDFTAMATVSPGRGLESAGHDAGTLRRTLTGLLADLEELPHVLIVFNHPVWDMYRIGIERHMATLNDFLAVNGQYVHALELNGLRSWKENREVATLAGKWNQMVISGGDRHGIEPNANVNLTQATCFTEFVHEVRKERTSHVLFMPQYADPWKHRLLQSTLAAIQDYPDFPAGSMRWDERVFHPDINGELRPLAELWGSPRAPGYLRLVLTVVRILGRQPISSGLRLAWNDAGEESTASAGTEG